jgi:methyl-accepting chemotaxis protein
MNWYKNHNARPRLAIAFGVLLLLTLGMGYLAVSSLHQANQRIADLYTDMQATTAAQDMAVSKADTARQDRDALMNITDKAIVDKDLKAAVNDLAAMHRELETAEQLEYTDQGKALLVTVRNDLGSYEKSVNGIIAKIRAGDAVGAKAGFDEMNTLAAKMGASINHVREFKQKQAQDKQQANSAAYASARNVTIGCALACLLVGSILAYVIARGFSVPLGQAVSALEKVAGGDLTAELDIHTRDEIGRMAAALNNAVGNLRATMQEAASGSADTTSSAKQLSAASESIASGAQEQAASLEETSASLEQITATVRHTADNARQASQLASASATSAHEGEGVVAKAIVAMSEIDASSQKISDIISTIDEIAFQTNLLAVNAAVEAARAGEEGRGFAVVATEVRSLAQRSAVAAKEIKVLIQDSVRKVEAGSALVNRSGETLQGIMASVRRVTDIVGEIAAASAEQSTGIEQVNAAMMQMDQVTQSNSAQTEQLSATAESLSDQATHLSNLINRFKLGDEQDKHEAPQLRKAVDLHLRAAPAAKRQLKARALQPKAKTGREIKPASSEAPAFASVFAAPAGSIDASFEEF